MYDCVATHHSNTILKFADDTTILGLITNNDETAYREEKSRRMSRDVRDEPLASYHEQGHLRRVCGLEA